MVATCGLVYELLAGALSSYLLGNSVTQFSLVIGLFLTAMGGGSFASRFVRRRLIRTFILVELLVGLLGGSSALLLFFAYAAVGVYLPVLVAACALVGFLVGLEIPLLVRILRRRGSLRATIGNVLSLDYLGALAASLLFPLVLVPRLGLVRTGFLFGLLNVLVALLGLRFFARQTRGLFLRLGAWGAAAVLALGLATAGRTTSWLEDLLYDDPIVFARSTPYQRIVLTRWRGDVRLFIDGNIQLSSVDEYRYHEALVHPAFGLVREPKEVLVLGGGDGMAIREILKYPSVRRVDLVDLDAEMTRLFSRLPPLAALNQRSLSDRRVRIFHTDAQKFLEEHAQAYDAIVIDLPDPNNEGLGKLYSRSFYRLVAQHLRPEGVFVTQATSPFYAAEAFWCIVNTIRASNPGGGGPALHALPYHGHVPSFGDWGFVLGSTRALSPSAVRLGVPTRFLTPELVPSLFVFPKDMGPRATPINRLDNQVLVRLYDQGYKRFNR